MDARQGTLVLPHRRRRLRATGSRDVARLLLWRSPPGSRRPRISSTRTRVKIMIRPRPTSLHSDRRGYSMRLPMRASALTPPAPLARHLAHGSLVLPPRQQWASSEAVLLAAPVASGIGSVQGASVIEAPRCLSQHESQRSALTDAALAHLAGAGQAQSTGCHSRRAAGHSLSRRVARSS